MEMLLKAVVLIMLKKQKQKKKRKKLIITEAATEPTLSLSPSSDSISNVIVSVVTNASYSDTK